MFIYIYKYIHTCFSFRGSVSVVFGFHAVHQLPVIWGRFWGSNLHIYFEHQLHGKVGNHDEPESCPNTVRTVVQLARTDSKQFYSKFICFNSLWFMIFLVWRWSSNKLFNQDVLYICQDLCSIILVSCTYVTMSALNFTTKKINYPGKRPQTVFKGLFMKLMKIGDHIKLRGSWDHGP